MIINDCINDIVSRVRIKTSNASYIQVLVDVREGFIANYRQCLESINRLFTGYTRLTVNGLLSLSVVFLLVVGCFAS